MLSKNAIGTSLAIIGLLSVIITILLEMYSKNLRHFFIVEITFIHLLFALILPLTCGIVSIYLGNKANKNHEGKSSLILGVILIGLMWFALPVIIMVMQY
ncbi:hypothetical protein J4479_01935 [Candidatus Woesearchaeota archaeon]|nr:hypothetical protein [Candidatus Woesearchaeota archaeon]